MNFTHSDVCSECMYVWSDIERKGKQRRKLKEVVASWAVGKCFSSYSRFKWLKKSWDNKCSGNKMKSVCILSIPAKGKKL